MSHHARNGADYTLYAIPRFIVDNCTPALESLSAEVEAIEDSVFTSYSGSPDVKRLPDGKILSQVNGFTSSGLLRTIREVAARASLSRCAQVPSTPTWQFSKFGMP